MPKEQYPTQKLLYVAWLDHYSSNNEDDWQTKEDIDETPGEFDRTVCSTVGYLVDETPEYLRLVATIGHVGPGTEHELYNGVMNIAKGCILAQRELRGYKTKRANRRSE